MGAENHGSVSEPYRHYRVMTIRVRPATADDMPWLLGQLAAFDQFFGSSRSLFPTMEQAEDRLAGLIASHPFLIAESAGSLPVGFIAGALYDHPYNPAIRWLAETFWWVAPEYRGTRAGLVLLNAFVTLGKQRADWITMTLEADSPVNPATLHTRGFRLKETSYLLEVERVAGEDGG